jgi:hypothetical protein
METDSEDQGLSQSGIHGGGSGFVEAVKVQIDFF